MGTEAVLSLLGSHHWIFEGMARAFNDRTNAAVATPLGGAQLELKPVKYFVRVFKGSVIGMLAGCIAASICAALLFAIYMAFSAIVNRQIAEGIAAATVGAFYFSVAGGIDGAWIGALVGGVSWLVPGAHWVRGVLGGIAGAIAGAAILMLRYTVNSGELRAGLFVVCFVVFGAVSAGVASAIVGHASARDRTPLNARAMP